LLRLIHITSDIQTFVFVQDVVGLYNGYFHLLQYSIDILILCRKFKIPNYQNGCAYITTHRVCYVDNAEPRKYAVVVDLSDVDRYDYYVSFLGPWNKPI